MATQPFLASNGNSEVEQRRNDDRANLREHFLSLPLEEQVNGWDVMWEKKITPWDWKAPNPALVDALDSRTDIFGSPFRNIGARKMRKKALVPGCGRGYDVLLFSSYGYDAYGLDAAPIAVRQAQQLCVEQGKEQHYSLKDTRNGRGEAKFILANFFVDGDFLSNTHPDTEDRTFDLIYDQTFLCALDPSMRPKWAARMGELLSPSGHLICMEYPLGKDPKLGGPPHGLEHELYEQLFAHPGREVAYNDTGHVCEDRSGSKAGNALVKVAEWTPENTFEWLKGKVMVSIWQHCKS